MLILFIDRILIDAEHPFERLMQGNVVVLDILAGLQLGDASQKNSYGSKIIIFFFYYQNSSILNGNESQANK